MKRPHPSYLITFGCLGILAGVAAAPLGLRVPLVCGLAVALLALIVRSRVALLLAILAGLAIGLWRGGLEQSGIRAYQHYIGQHVELTGRVSEDPTTRPDGTIAMKLGEIQIDGQPLPSRIWASTETNKAPRRGDQLILRGQMRKGFGGLPATMASASTREVIPGHEPAVKFRDWFANRVRQVISEPEASLSLGFLTGQRDGLPEETANQLKLLGLTHIIVASGYNLTILVRLTRRLLARVSKYLSVYSAAIMIAGFIAITGFSPSMVRAGIVAGLSLLAGYYGRRVHPVTLILFAAAISLMRTPSYIWGDLGWFLSFAAFGGVLVLAPLVHQYFWGSAKPGAIRQLLIDTLCAQAATMPIIALAFGQIALLAVPANLLILPMIPVIMVLTFIAGLIGPAVPIAALPAELLTKLVTAVSAALSRVPSAQQELVATAQWMLLAYILLLAAALYMWRRTKLKLYQVSLVD